MSVAEKIEAVEMAVAAMESSKMVCVQDAKSQMAKGNEANALARIEKGAQYAWGFGRPAGW
jgi:hypothetical protein